MNAFHVIGAVTAIWAVVLGFLGIRVENFPGRFEKVVAAISIVLVVSAISAAILTAKDEGGEQSGAAEATHGE